MVLCEYYTYIIFCYRSLVHVLKARHVVTEVETRYYMQQLVNGVQYIHQQNIIHRKEVTHF